MSRAPTTPEQRRATEVVRPEKPFARFRWIVTLAILAPFLWTTLTVDANWGRLDRIPERTVVFVRVLIENASLEHLVLATEAMWESIAIAWVATLVGVVLSFPLVFLASFNLAGSWVTQPTRQVLNFFRAVPEIALAIVLIPFFGLSAVTAAVAMGVSSIGTLGKLSAEIVEGIDGGPLEAVEASGGGWLQKVRWGALPQAMPEIAAFWLYRFEINVRISAILGVIGLGGIGTFIAEGILNRQYDRVGLGLVVVVAITMVIDAVSSRIRRRIIDGPPVELDVKREEAARAQIAGEQA